MKNMKEMMDSAANSSAQSVKNWMETAQKAGQNMMSPNAFEKNSELYREWLNNQMNILRPENPEKEQQNQTTEQTSSSHQEVLSDWYAGQLESAKKMMDFNREVFNNWISMTSNSRPGGAWSNANFNNMSDTWKNIMNSAFDNMSNMLSKGVAKDAFSNMFFTGNMMQSLQNFYKPVFDSMQKGSFDAHNWQKFFSPAQYKDMVENMFSNFFPQNSVKDIFEQYARSMHQQLSSMQDLNSQSWNAWKAAADSFPFVMNQDSGKFLNQYHQWTEHYAKTIAPLMKLMAPGKEKEQLEHTLSVLDKLAVLNIKQSQLQFLVYKAGANAISHSMNMVATQFQQNHQSVEFQKFFTEWTAANEKVFTTLFASEEYSELKAEILSLGLNIRRDMEKQFEQSFSSMPFVFRSEADELHKTIHDLKKKVRDLEARMSEIATSSSHKSSDAPSSKTKKSSR